MGSTLIVTTGDRDGIGLEVSLKALAKLKAPSNPRIVLVIDIMDSDLVATMRYRSKLPLFIFDLEDLQDAPPSAKFFVLLRQDSPAHWVQSAAKYCLKNKSAALVTGPLSKTLIREAGLKDMGHTGILKRVTRSKVLFMGFVGDTFSVVLATDHLPLAKVSKSLSAKKLSQAFQAAVKLRALGNKKFRTKPIAVLGLNPHAGESGMLGAEELRLVVPAMRKFRQGLVGPLVPDAAFRPHAIGQFSVYVALYHDQGLIPFKMAHGGTSAHITLGLPFIRTSVDHGTAKDIFGQDMADPASMLRAMEVAISLGLQKKKRRNS